jgi:hypothetical protein
MSSGFRPDDDAPRGMSNRRSAAAQGDGPAMIHSGAS